MENMVIKVCDNEEELKLELRLIYFVLGLI